MAASRMMCITQSILSVVLIVFITIKNKRNPQKRLKKSLKLKRKELQLKRDSKDDTTRRRKGAKKDLLARPLKYSFLSFVFKMSQTKGMIMIIIMMSMKVSFESLYMYLSFQLEIEDKWDKNQ